MELSGLFDAKLVKFIGVGIANTALSALIMFGLYNLTVLDYWSVSAIAYVAGAIFSFFMSKMWTFQDQGKTVYAALRFILCVAGCYLFAFGLARPLVRFILQGSSFSTAIIDQVSMGVAMILYTGANYVLQRFFVFQHQSSRSKEGHQ